MRYIQAAGRLENDFVIMLTANLACRVFKIPNLKLETGLSLVEDLLYQPAGVGWLKKTGVLNCMTGARACILVKYWERNFFE